MLANGSPNSVYVFQSCTTKVWQSATNLDNNWQGVAPFDTYDCQFLQCNIFKCTSISFGKWTIIRRYHDWAEACNSEDGFVPLCVSAGSFFRVV